eukprot:3656493-Rhodomonas_salina.2
MCVCVRACVRIRGVWVHVSQSLGVRQNQGEEKKAKRQREREESRAKTSGKEDTKAHRQATPAGAW